MRSFIPLDWHTNSNYPESTVSAALRNIPMLFDSTSARSAEEQLSAHFPGITSAPPEAGFSLSANSELLHPAIDALAPAAFAIHLGERIFVYPAGFICISQLSGSYKLFKLEI